MILKAKARAKPWSPGGFDDFRARYPDTQWQSPTEELDRTRAFSAAWEAHAQPPEGYVLVLTPGLFSEWLPGCFSRVRKRLLAEGYRCLQPSVSTRRSVAEQSRHLRDSVLRWLNPGERFIWCTHSKGGIDALYALESDTELRERCRALVAVQLPVGRSGVIEQIESDTAGRFDRLLRAGLRRSAVAAGVEFVSPRRDPQLDAWLRSFESPVPMIHAVSWSEEPTSLLDSWHGRLNALRPGHAHDGQFYLCDQRLANTSVVCLPRLDHAQPVLGGLGLDVPRLWLSLASLASQE